MKKIVFFATLVLVFSVQVFSQYSVVGKWLEKSSGGEKNYLEFDGEGHCRLSFGDEYIDMTYTIDYTKSPTWLDFSINEVTDDGVMEINLLGIVRFDDIDIMILRLAGDDKPRPTTFLPEGNEETETYYKVL